MSPYTDGQDLFACTVDESAGLAEGCPYCRSTRSTLDDGARICEGCGAVFKDSALSFCTSSEDCTADVDGHRPDCPVEAKLKDTFGY